MDCKAHLSRDRKEWQYTTRHHLRKETVATDCKSLQKENEQSQWNTSHYLRSYRKLWRLTARYYIQNFTWARVARISVISCKLIREVRTFLP